jgi:diguanylate cyclase (GGDEF)-like protein/PAS domain S-box-containing protein
MPRQPRKPAAPKPGSSGRAAPAASDDQSLWLRAVFDHSALGIARLDRGARIVNANAAFQRFFDRGLSDLSGRSIGEFAAAEDAASIITLVAEAAAGASRTASREARFVRPDGRVSWAVLMLSRAGEQRDSGLIAVVQDVSERKALETELLHQAFHDSLTGLANRALFRDRVDHALAYATREAERIGVLFIDLDDFKSINDTQGHATGDLVLQRVASVLLNATRGCDTVSRLGGDEFAILLERVNHDEGPEVAAQRIVNALARPIETAPGRRVTVGASIGIAMQKVGEGGDELLRDADVALYEAKTRSRGRWIVYDPAMHAALVDKVSLEADLRTAIERCQLSHRPGLEKTGRYPTFRGAGPKSQISLAYQPIVNMATEVLTGFEALLRWTHPDRGTIAPSTFVPIAEESGLGLALGRWVLRTACHQASAWNSRRSGPPLSITVNLSGRQLLDGSLAIDVESALDESGLSPTLLILEMTESVIMKESAAARTRLHELKQIGVRLAIDDFGTGYSSLSQLQQFPVDILKIDQSFLHRMHQGEHDAALVRTIIALARALSLSTIAEGVEDAEQRQQLRDLGCDSAQGFLFGRPMAVEEIDATILSPMPAQVLPG